VMQRFATWLLYYLVSLGAAVLERNTGFTPVTVMRNRHEMKCFGCFKQVPYMNPVLTLDWSSFTRSQDSSVGIATGYGLDDQGIGVRVPIWSKFSLLHVVQIVHPSYPMGTAAFFPGGKATGV
jgi:hypothetical protein